MEQKMFSIIMPLYNKAPYVHKAVESVIAQTRKDWEMVVVDDGSTDGSTDEIPAAEEGRILLFRQPNSGPGATRNRGARESSGRYLCFLDADDKYEPQFLEEMAALIQRHPNAGIYATGYFIEKNSRRRVAPIGVDEEFEEGPIDYCATYARTLCMPVWTGAACMPREVFFQMGGFDEELRLGEDFLLWVHTALKHPIVLLRRPLSCYMQDVDPTFRGTHRLHPPERHMLWHLADLEPLERENGSYKTLIDRLRTYTLKDYLLSPLFRAAAQAELKKVDWAAQPRRTRLLYSLPLWMLRARETFLKTGSKIKQWLIETLTIPSASAH